MSARSDQRHSPRAGTPQRERPEPRSSARPPKFMLTVDRGQTEAASAINRKARNALARQRRLNLRMQIIFELLQLHASPEASERARAAGTTKLPFCEECGFGNWLALDIAHANDDGAAQRRQIHNDRSAGAMRVLRAIAQDIYNGREHLYYVACANCNQVRQRSRNKL